MPSIRDIEPEILKGHHRLGAQQINSLLGEGVAEERIEDKLVALEMVNEFIRITDALRDSAISFVPLKGPVLSYRLYGDPTARVYWDIDILVEASSLSKAADVLIGLGYLPESAEMLRNKREVKILARHTNELAFQNAVTKITVELHWRLLNVPPVSDSRLEDIIRMNSTVVEFAGRSFTVLNNELELLYLSIHGGLHWWHRLKWLVDIDDFLKIHKINKERFILLANEFKAWRIVGLCNEILGEYFPHCKKLPVIGKAEKFMVIFSKKRIESQTEPINDFYGRAFASVRYSLVSFPGLKYKLKTIRNYLFVVHYYGNNRFLSTLPLFYVYGPLRLLAERARR